MSSVVWNAFITMKITGALITAAIAATTQKRSARRGFACPAIIAQLSRCRRSSTMARPVRMMKVTNDTAEPMPTWLRTNT